MDEWWQLVQQFNGWDTVLALVLGISALIGLWRGLLLEVASLAGVIVAFLGAQWGAYIVQQMLPGDVSLLSHAQIRWIVAFLLLFVTISATCTLVARWLRKWLRKAGLGGLDRLLGMVFGVARALVLLWVMTTVVIATPLRESSSWQQSAGIPWLQTSLQVLTPLLPPTFMQWLQLSTVHVITRQHHGATAVVSVLPQLAASAGAVGAAEVTGTTEVSVPLNR